MLGTIDLWFRLHTNDVRPIQQFVADKQTQETRDKDPIKIEHDVQFLIGEKDEMIEREEKKKGKILAERKKSNVQKKKVDLQKQLESQIQAELQKQLQLQKENEREELEKQNAAELQEVQSAQEIASQRQDISGTSKESKVKDESSKDLDQLSNVSKHYEAKAERKKSESSKKNIKESREKFKPKKDREESYVNDKEANEVLNSKASDNNPDNANSDDPMKQSFTTLSKKTSSQLGSIIKNRAKPPRTFKKKNIEAQKQKVSEKSLKFKTKEVSVSESSDATTLGSVSPVKKVDPKEDTKPSESTADPKTLRKSGKS